MRYPIRTALLALAGLVLTATALPAAATPEPSHLQRTFGDSPDVGHLWVPEAPAKAKRYFRGINPHADHKPGIHPHHRHGAKGIRVPHRHAKSWHERANKGSAAANKSVVHKRKARCGAKPMAPAGLDKPRPDMPRAAHKKHWKQGHAHKVRAAGEARDGGMPDVRTPHYQGKRAPGAVKAR